ncbi:uncharacterized protein LOC129945737 isoform X1 [Eupeodes corollae]|uniref:uncharacterized protein LOC129945737 isoform X1 n=1 Tax=Eupeodes corollae TaxID=290404 RepID=UPI0024916475|nr:uncharacterized protein LOC129945737 isoform X1 [Eupeodes corollae]
MNSDSSEKGSSIIRGRPYSKMSSVVDADFEKFEKPQERYVWEMRTRSPNTTPASTVLNSPDLAEVQYSQHHGRQHQIRVGRSPVSQVDNMVPQGLTSPGSPTDVGKAGGHCVRDGEIVVFDDIDTNWIKSQAKDGNVDDILKVTKMIGQLPIAEYEGSPRRIGTQQQGFSLQGGCFKMACATVGGMPTRPPGFPQRVSQHSSPATQQENNHKSENLIDIDGGNGVAEVDTDNRNESSTAADESRSKTPTFDYLYEFSETRKVLEEFFKGANTDEKQFADFAESDDLGSSDTHQDYEREEDKKAEQAYIGQRLARIPKEELYMVHRSPRKQQYDNYNEQNDIELYIDSNSRSSGELADTELEANLRRHSRNFTLSPETTDYDSNCGDLDSLSNDINLQTDFGKLYTSMPVLEDGLSSGHASDTENNISVVIDKKFLECNNLSVAALDDVENNSVINNSQDESDIEVKQVMNDVATSDSGCCNTALNNGDVKDAHIYDAVYATNVPQNTPPPPPAPVAHRPTITDAESQDIQEAMKDIRSALQRAKTLPEKAKFCDEVLPAGRESPIWVPRTNSHENSSVDVMHKGQCHTEEEEHDTDLETDRLLGQQRLDDQGFYDDKQLWSKNSPTHSPTTSDITMLNNSTSVKPQTFSSATIRQGIGTALTPTSPEHCQIIGTGEVTITSPEKLQYSKSPTGSIKSLKDSTNSDKKAKTRNKEALLDPAVLIEGVLFRARYLGSTQLVCEGQPTKSTRMMQAEEAVSRIKAPEGESQPSTEVDLFISTEKIMVLNTDLKEIMMDHALRTISYIADIGDLVVLMARRRFVPADTDEGPKPNRTPKMICHVFESDEAQFIAQSIGQAFQVAYMEFLKANGIEDHSFVKEMDYQEVLNSQEIFGDELEIFAKKELQKEVVVPKAKGEILGVVIVESGWGSMLPTVVIANLMSAGAAARCGQLNIGDQLIAINGMSLVGLPLSTCQSYIRNAKNQTAVKFTVVPCPPVVEVKIKRPNTKYQLGFSVQNGVICSLLRGGIAERGGVRVGHRIIEINNQSVVAVPHEKIVNLLATSVGEILMKTMPTSMFRLLTGQENPIFI